MMAIDDQLAIFSVDVAFESSMYGVILEHVHPSIRVQSGQWIHVFEIDERIVDRFELDARILQSVSEDLS